MPSEDGPSASALIERERRFQALRARARGLDLRVDVLLSAATLEHATGYRPIDLISGQPALGPDPRANVLNNLDELEMFLDAQIALA